jgi:hypothetical protein
VCWFEPRASDASSAPPVAPGLAIAAAVLAVSIESRNSVAIGGAPGQPHPAVDGGHRVARHEARVEPGQREVIEHAQERHVVRVAVGVVRGRAGVERGRPEVAAPVEIVAERGVDRLHAGRPRRVADPHVAALDRRGRRSST